MSGCINKAVVDALCAKPRETYMFAVLEIALGALYMACNYVALWHMYLAPLLADFWFQG